MTPEKTTEQAVNEKVGIGASSTSRPSTAASADS